MYLHADIHVAGLPKNAADSEESITDVAPTDRGTTVQTLSYLYQLYNYIDFPSVDRTLAVFVWRSVTHHATQQHGQSEQTEESFMAVFDINCWYYSQMPEMEASGWVSNTCSCSFVLYMCLC